MEYAININGVVNFVLTDETPLPVNSVYGGLDVWRNYPRENLKIIDTNGAPELALKTDEEIRIQELPLKYKNDLGFDAMGNQLWSEKTQEEKDAVDLAEQQAILDEEEAWQLAKSPSLKALENIYVDFITNMWTPALRTAGLIANDYTITVDNTDEPTNMYLLMQLRQLDYNTYDTMGSEFLRLKIAITGNGGVMSRVRQHS